MSCPVGSLNDRHGHGEHRQTGDVELSEMRPGRPEGRGAARPDARSKRSAAEGGAAGRIEPATRWPLLGERWVGGAQRLAGNRAVADLLTNRFEVLQRADDPAPAAAPPAAAPPGTGREPTKQERQEWGDYFPDVEFRILRPPEDGYNCFAWAVGSTAGLLTYQMLEQAGFGHDLDGWTGYLAAVHGFGHSADGLDEGADLILYGEGTQTILHAARRADVPFDRLTFSSKLGGGTTKTPVILHAPADVQGMHYGKALRSFRRGSGATPGARGQ